MDAREMVVRIVVVVRWLARDRRWWYADIAFWRIWEAIFVGMKGNRKD